MQLQLVARAKNTSIFCFEQGSMHTQIDQPSSVHCVVGKQKVFEWNVDLIAAAFARVFMI